ncbi:hypothetical protein CRUP_008104, partial [Coryphaenoides rupestris]
MVAVAELPLDECQGSKPPGSRPCYRAPCPGGVGPQGGTEAEGDEEEEAREELHDWEYDGFSECSESCGGAPTATVVPPTTMTEEEEEEEEEQRGLGSGSKHMKVHTWQVAAWSPCSASCGGGTQGRRVTCVEGPDHRPLELGSERCVGGAGRRPPSDARPCNPQPCASWTSGHWGARRSVQCQETAGGAKAPHRLCAGLQSAARNCSSEACALQWRTGPWTQCTATCGRHGFQSRHVACVHPRTGRGGRDHQCASAVIP